MAFTIVFLPPAKTDIKTASQWYEDKQRGLGKEFRKDIIETSDSLSEQIKEYGPVYMELSRIITKRFPFVIYFKKDVYRSRLVVYGVLHKKQSRDILNQRL